jgi:hypothetical protein
MEVEGADTMVVDCPECICLACCQPSDCQPLLQLARKESLDSDFMKLECWCVQWLYRKRGFPELEPGVVTVLQPHNVVLQSLFQTGQADLQLLLQRPSCAAFMPHALLNNEGVVKTGCVQPH